MSACGSRGRRCFVVSSAWGRLSPFLDDYTNRGIHNLLQTKRGQRLQSLVDPISYRDRLKQPKLIVTATNDRYWPVDALNVYWDKLQGEKYILHLPNNRHSRADWPRLIGALIALNERAAKDKKLPRLTWSFTENNGSLWLSVRSDTRPAKVRIWSATSSTRDFREARWTSRSVPRTCDTYAGKIRIPTRSCIAVFAEAVYESTSFPLYLSTQIRIAGTVTGSKVPSAK